MLKDYLSGGLLSWCPTVRRHAIYVAQRCSEYAYIWPTLYSSPHKSALSEKKMRRSLCIWDREHDANMTSLELSWSVRLCRFLGKGFEV